MRALPKIELIRLPRAKIVRALGETLPKGRTFTLRVEKSVLGGMNVIKVVTQAWKKLRPAERIARVRDAVESILSREERDNILRFSVLTPEEYKTIFGKAHPGSGSKPPVKSKAARLPARKTTVLARKKAGGKAKKQP